MNVGIFTRGKRGYFLVRRLLETDIDIKFICQTRDGRYCFLRKIAEDNTIPYLHIIDDINNNVELIKSFKCDLLISCGYDQIFKSELINLGIINCHGSALPKYRGRNVLKRALENNDKEFGITVHHVDSGIDTGKIIVQRLYQINNNTYRQLLNKVRKESATVILEAIGKLYDRTI